MSQRKPPPPAFICPQCKGPKAAGAKICKDCRYPNKNRIEEVLRGIAESKTIAEIAIALGVGKKTVEYHWFRGKVKYGLQCPQDATKLAIRMGWITV